MIPLSVHNKLHSLTDEQGNWIAVLPTRDVATLPTSAAVSLLGEALTVTVHNCRCVHRSQSNLSAEARLLLLQTFSPASCAALPTGSNVAVQANTLHGDTLVRGEDAKTVVWDERACPANQEAPWMPDPATAVYDWERLAAMVQRTR